MKTTVEQFIAPYIETVERECLIGATRITRVKRGVKLQIIETSDIGDDINAGYGRNVVGLSDEDATIIEHYNYPEDVPFKGHTLFVTKDVCNENDDVLCSLDLDTMEMTTCNS